MLDYDKCIRNCMEKYGLSESEASRIVKTKDYLLNVEDLRYKYDNPNLGKEYPKWLDKNIHINMCYKVAFTYFQKRVYDCIIYDAEDVAIELYIWSLIRLSSWDSYALLKCALVCRCKTMTRDIIEEMKYQKNIISTEEKFSNEYIFNTVEHDYLVSNKNVFDDLEFIDTIKSIKDWKTQSILVFIGYFILDLDILFDMVVDIYVKSPSNVKNKIYDICMDDKRLCNYLDLNYQEDVNCTKPIGKILKVFGNRNKHQYLENILKPCLKNMGISFI